MDGLVASKSEDFVEGVGRRTAEIRQERGWTQEEAAERLEVTVRHMKRIESGHNMTLRTLQWIASVLKVTPAALVSPPKEWAPRRPGRPRARKEFD